MSYAVVFRDCLKVLFSDYIQCELIGAFYDIECYQVQEDGMSDFFALVKWNRGEGEVFTDNKYSRKHNWEFDGGIQVPASAAPSIVPLPYSAEHCVDPEEAFVASLSSCHMLFFLSIAARKKLLVDSYIDNAVGTLEINQEGKIAITKVVLRPKAVFVGDVIPDYEAIKDIHANSHQQCFIANSVTTDVYIEIER